MTSNVVLEVIERIDRLISEEEGDIFNSLARIEQLRFNIMLSSKNKAIAINNLKRRIASSKRKIVDLKARKTIISVS